MNKKNNFTKKEVEELLENVIGKKIGDVDTKGLFLEPSAKTNKGIVGNIVEQCIFNKDPDNDPTPDILIDGIETEIKSTGLINKGPKNQKKLGAKECVTVTAVSIRDLPNQEFNTSFLWHKLEETLLVYYFYDKTNIKAKKDFREYRDFPFIGYQMNEFTDEDKETIKNDWELIKQCVEKIDLNSKKFKEDFKNEKHKIKKQLAMLEVTPSLRFRLKQNALDSIISKKYNKPYVHTNIHITKYSEIDDLLHTYAQKYKGWTIENLIKHFKIEPKENTKINKSIAEKIVCQMLGTNAKRISKIEVFDKFGLIGKTIIASPKNTYTEQMKLFSIDFDEARNIDIGFEDSSVFAYFNDNQFLCIIFQEPYKDCPLEKCVFKGFKRIDFSESFIFENVLPVWNKIRDLIINETLIDVIRVDKDGNPVVNKNGIISSAPNFPKQKDNVVFIRGTSSNSSVKPLLINNVRMYNQQYWIKGKYIFELMNEQDWI